MSKAKLLSLSTAVPEHVLTQEHIASEAQKLFSGTNKQFHRFLPVYENAQVDKRYSSVDIPWMLEDHNFQDINDKYVESAMELLEKVSVEAIRDAGLEISDVDDIFCVSTTGIATPSLEAQLMERLQMKRSVRRTPIFGLGCAGGLIGLGRAARWAEAHPGKKVLLLVIELCCLTFQKQDLSKTNVIATALFGEGAAGAIISTEGDGPKLGAQSEHTWAESLDVMGFNFTAKGPQVLLKKDVPHLVRTKMRGVVDDFLDENQVDLNDIDDFVCHPGGAKVIDALEEILELSPQSLVHTRNVLRNFGNMSSATVLFVLKEALATAKEQDKFLLTALGPGFTAGLMLVEN